MIAPRRHPTVSRPLIDYKTMLLLEPIVLLGTVPGKILNKVFPTLLLYVLLLILLIVICIRTWQKYFRFARAQREREAAEKAAADSNTDVSPEVRERQLNSRKSLYLDTMTGVLEADGSTDSQTRFQEKNTCGTVTDMLTTKLNSRGRRLVH